MSSNGYKQLTDVTIANRSPIRMDNVDCIELKIVKAFVLMVEVTVDRILEMLVADLETIDAAPSIMFVPRLDI